MALSVTRPSITTAATRDSIGRGWADNSLYGGDGTGFAVRACEAASRPWVMIARPSSGAADWVDAYGRKIRVGLAADCDAFIWSLGGNDINSMGRTAAQAQADIITTLNSICAQRGIPAWLCTIVPLSVTSTDAYATLANQTPNATVEPKRVALNDWIRDGCPVTSAAVLTPVATGTSGALRSGQPGHPVAGYFEVADTVESSRNSGKWNVNGTANWLVSSDNVHPTTAGHTLMAAAVNTSAFAARR